MIRSIDRSSYVMRCRNARHRAGQRLRAGHPRHARQPAAGRLADAQSHLRRAALQPARPGQPRQCRWAQDGLDARPRAGHLGDDTDRRARGHVRGQPRRRRPGDQCHERRSALGILARDSQGDGRRHRRADAGEDQGSRHLRGPGLLRLARRFPGRAGRQDRQGALGDQASRLQGPDPVHVGADRRRRQGDHRPHLRETRRLLHRRARRQDRQGALEILQHAGAGRAGRRFTGAMCRSRDASRAAGGCRAPTIPCARCSTGRSPIPSPGRGGSATATSTPFRAPRRPSSTATRPSRSMSRPASSSGTISICRATIGISITSTSARWCAPPSIPIPRP